LKTILSSLRDNDVSIRRRALDILYVMCTQQTSSKVVDELLSYSDEPDQAIKEELVLKIAILAEKFADNLVWYIDVVVRLVTSSGDYITDDIWFRIIQIITGFGKEPDPELQKYAANKMLSALSVPNVHENLVKIGSYILAEYGELISHQPGKDPVRIFDTLNRHFTVSSAQTKAMLMNSYVKLAHRFPDLRDFVVPIFEIHSEHWDPDIQQRALEYLKLLQEDSTIEGVRPVILGKMPVYSEAIQTNNPLLTRIYALKLGPKSKDPTVMHEAKKLAEEEMFKSRSHTTNTQIFSTLQTLSKKETDYNTSNSSAKSYQTSAPVMNNLLDGYDEPAPSSDIKSHPLFNIAKNKLAVNVSNIVPLPGKLQFSNFNEMKALMTAKDGILYQDNNVEIQYKSQFDGPVGKIALQFATKGSSITQLNFNVQNTSNLFFQVSPVKYAEHPQIMMQVMNTGISSEVPKANMKFYQGEAFRNVDFEVPVTVNKFINPVDMPADKFLQFYNDYTTANNDKYFRLDAFIKNPAPPQVPVSEVMKKVGALLTNGLNFKAKFVDEDTKTEICGTANYTYKSESSANNVNLPIMVNVEAYTENKEFLRLSFRSAVASDVLKGLYQIVVFYLNP
jgi:AP-2 complex subunit alpha